jgi:hypothetical protein
VRDLASSTVKALALVLAPPSAHQFGSHRDDEAHAAGPGAADAPVRLQRRRGGLGLAVDGASNVIVVGSTSATGQTSAVGYDAFVQKLDAAGAVRWFGSTASVAGPARAS